MQVLEVVYGIFLYTSDHNYADRYLGTYNLYRYDGSSN